MVGALLANCPVIRAARNANAAPGTSHRGCSLRSFRARRRAVTCAFGREGQAGVLRNDDSAAAADDMQSLGAGPLSASVSRRALLFAGSLATAAPAAWAEEEVLAEVETVAAPVVNMKKALADCQILVVRRGPDEPEKCEWGATPTTSTTAVKTCNPPFPPLPPQPLACAHAVL